jgi:peptidoglycan/xylan/chitin deacetylase (PgdA/CDA1 family)
VSSGTGVRAEVALTFDDGPSPWTGEIAAALEGHGCRATFFIRGAAIEERPEVLAAIARAGHEVGNHLWSHPDATGLSRAEIRAEIKRTADAIGAVTGQRPQLVRPPYCKAPHAVAIASRWMGVKAIVQRSIASGDWDARAPESVSEPLLEGAIAGDIIGLHDGISPDERDTDSREVTVSAVKRLIPGLLERGLQPVTVSQLLA